MMLGQIVLALSLGGVLVTGYLAVIFTANPAVGMKRTHHLPEFLPKVMADRYIANLVLAVAATLYANFAVIAVLFAVFAFMGLADAVIYARAAKPFRPHLLAGLAAAGVAFFALVAQMNGALS